MTETLDGIARRGAHYAQQLALRSMAPVHLIGHSLGGLVILRMFELGLLAPDRFSGDFCRIVLLGSPVNGSQSGQRLARLWPTKFLLGAAGAEVQLRQQPRQWMHSTQVGVIAGTRPRGLGQFLHSRPEPHDGTVTISETELAGAADRIILPVSHTGMLMSESVADQIAAFLAQGRFKHND